MTSPADASADATAPAGTGTVRIHRIFRAPPERLYRAFLDPDAMAKWSAPHGFTGRVHEIDATVGGGYKMSFTNFSTGESHSFGGRYQELVPHERIRYTDAFDEPGPAGTMAVTIDIRPVVAGSELRLVQEGLPAEIPVELATMGWQESMQLLAQLVEAEIPGAGSADE